MSEEKKLRKLTTKDLERANIPKLYWHGVALKNIPDEAPHKKIALRYYERVPELVPQGIGLYLWSPENGTGKTAISSILGKRALRCGFTVFFIRSQELKDATVERRGFDEHSTIAERARSVDLLILDDFGKEYKTESGYAETLIEDFLRERTQKMKATIVTSNLNPARIGQEFATDLAEVMKESFRILRVAGPEEGGKNWRNERQEYIRRLI